MAKSTKAKRRTVAAALQEELCRQLQENRKAVSDRLPLYKCMITSELRNRKGRLALPPCVSRSLAQQVGHTVCEFLAEDKRVESIGLPWFRPFCKKAGICKEERIRLLQRLETSSIFQEMLKTGLRSLMIGELTT